MVGLACESYEMMADEYPETVDVGEFTQFIEGETLADEWGTEIKYERTLDGYFVVSAGADKKFDTIDDIKLTSKQTQTWNN